MFYSFTDKLFFKSYFYHMAFEEERSIKQYIVLALLRRFQKRSQICRENGLFQHLACMKSRSQRILRRQFSSLNSQISFLPCGYFHLTSIKASYKFSRDFKVQQSSHNANFKNICSASQSSLEIFPLGTPTRIQVTYFKVPTGILAYARSLSNNFKIFQPMF